MFRMSFNSLSPNLNIISLIKDLLHSHHLWNVELEHVLNSVLQSHNTAWARGARTLKIKIKKYIQNLPAKITCIFNLTTPSSKPM